MQSERFGGFELDEEARQLRFEGAEIALQPRVFDLIAFLVRNRHRVVDKEELLETLWPGVVVTDASLQRAVSLARGALRKGGLENAIRTYSRHGYRFCFDQATAAPVAAPGAESECATSLSLARGLADQRRWAEAAARYAAADREETLAPADLERWAVAEQCAGHLAGAIEPLERAGAGYAGANQDEAAARASLLLARVQLESRDTAVANGCLKRAETLLQDLPLGREHGHLAWLSARFAFFVGDAAAAQAHAHRAVDIGRRIGDPEVEAMGRLYSGIALQCGGEVQRGLELQDEAAAAVLAGAVSPLVGGIVYCGLIAGCCNSGDWPRAGQWTARFSRWCERSGLRTYSGACALHRAEVFAARGELGRAERELEEAGEPLRKGAPWAIGDAYRLLGDIHLARGEFERAESAYRAAHEHGCDPYPGYAVLLHYRGQSQAALRGLQRAVTGTTWVAGERRGLYLAHIAIIAALCGELDQASAALATLEETGDLATTGAVRSHAMRARAELEAAWGDHRAAARLFRDAVAAWNKLESPVDAAVTRVRLAECLRATGDSEDAELELASAQKAFERCGAIWHLEQCRRLRSAGMARPETT